MSARQKFLGRVRNRLAVERQVRAWRRDLAPLRAESAPAPTRTVLFCDLMTMIATAKVESLMAGLLRLKGYRAVVLLERPDWPLEAIFRAAAPDTQFIYRSAEIGPQDLAEARKAAETILENTGLQSLVALEVDGYRIGRSVLSWVLRQFRVGRLDDADPSHRAAALDTLTQSLVTKAFVERMLKERAPSTAVFVERGYTPAGEVFDGCALAGVDVIQWCGAPQSDCLIYKRYNEQSRGDHPLSVSEGTWKSLLAMPWGADNDAAVADQIVANYESGAWYNRQQLQEGKSVVKADAVRQALGLDPRKKTAIIFCHILYDATFFYGESLFEDYEQWMVETVRAAIANPNLNWIVKVHPVNVWRCKMDGSELVQLEAETLRRHFGELPAHVKIMPADTGINTFSLFEVADVGLTVRGTIGMELPCFGIPVVTAGTGRYTGRGFTIEPNSREDYAARLARLHETPRLDAETIRRARLHYYGALALRPAPMRSFILEHATGKGDGSGTDVKLNRRVDAGLLDSVDLGGLIHWLVDERSQELLTKSL
jgi:hypothetical protein